MKRFSHQRRRSAWAPVLRLWAGGGVVVGMFVAGGCASKSTAGQQSGAGDYAIDSAETATGGPAPDATGSGAAGMIAVQSPGSVGVGVAGMSAPVVTDPGISDEPLACEDLSYQTFGEQFLASYCTGCHGGPTPTGQLALDSEDKIAARLAGALRQVESGKMPRGNNLPSDDERATFVTWLQCELDATPPEAGDQGDGDDDDDFDADLDDDDFDEDRDDDDFDDDDDDDDFDEDLDEDLDEARDEAEDLDEDLDEALDEAEDRDDDSDEQEDDD